MLILVLATCGQGSGCALFFNTDEHVSTIANRQILPPVPSPRNAVEIEVYFVDRPLGDTLTGESLWKSLNQASGSLRDHVQLREAGFRYGLAPSTAPFALQALLDPGRSAGTARQTQRQSLTIPAGESTLLEIGSLTGSRIVPSSDKAHPSPRQVTDARCVVRMNAERVQEGWIRLTLVPEIHHGENRVRPVATDRAYAYRASQDIEQYFDQQFSVEMNRGEYVVIGQDGEGENSLGGLFFRGADPAGRINRLMIVRLVGMHEVQAVRQEFSRP